jgi:hypothetical protein
MTEADRVVWSAVFARTNYGHELPSAQDMRRYRTAARHGTQLPAMVNMVCADLMESDDHYEMFLDEAKSWQTGFYTQELDYIFSTWPNKRAVWEASEVAA